MNITNLTIKEYLVPQNQVYVVEELCEPYIQSLGSFYISVAIFNVCYSFTWVILNKFRDKIIFNFKLEESNFRIKFTIGNLADALDVTFFLLNFFVFGYWLVLKHTDWFLNLWITKFFI